MKVLVLANTYTGARFETPPTKDQVQVLDACVKIILRDYLSLSIEELDEAFSLAVGGKFEGLNIETYYGDFTPHILGKILKAYSMHRKKVLGAFNEQTKLIGYKEERHTEQEKEEMNEAAKKKILVEYNAAKEEFNKDPLKFNEELIKGFWAKTLVKEGVIVFTHEEKKDILRESKAYCVHQLKLRKIEHGVGFSEMQTIKHTLKRVADGDQDSEFKAAVVAKYSRLLIIKSFIQTQ